MINGLLQLKELSLAGTNFNQECWGFQRDCSHHLKMIQHLDLERCNDLSGASIHAMLCSMPNLETFQAGVIAETDILPLPEQQRGNDDDGEAKEGQAWVCLGLKKLVLMFTLLDPVLRTVWQNRVLTLLATLERLEYCRLCDAYTEVPSGHELRLKLDLPPGGVGMSFDDNDEVGRLGGLDRLRTLKKLHTFVGPVSDVTMWGKDEARWVLKYWPEMRQLTGVKFTTGAQELLKGRLVVGGRLFRSKKKKKKRPS